MVLEKPLARTLRVPQSIGLERIRSSSINWQKASSLPDSKALQLLILTQFFPPDFAATGQLIEELVKQLDYQGVDVRVFTGQPGYAFANEKATKAPKVEKTGRVWVKRSRMTQLFSHRISGKAISGLLFALRVILHLIRRSRSYDVTLVTTAPPFLPVIAYLANVFLGARYVCLLYDLYPDIAVELDVVSDRHPIAKLWRLINRQVWRRAENVIVLSSSMKQRVISHCPDIEDKVSVIHSWANPDKILPIQKRDNWFAQEHNLVDPFVVMYSGNMGRCHDIDTIFAAAELLKDEPIQFVFIGDGAKRSQLIESVLAAKLNNFLFLPYQEKSDLPYSLTACDLSLVSVSEGMESLVAPSKLYPAMATGRPVAAVCPPSSYLGSLLDSAQGGTAFANGEAKALAAFICELSQNRFKAERLGKSGRQYVQANFTPERVAKQYLQVLTKAAER
ncbi:MAG: glycosyltransferase family 4 protein [Phormidesmis sp.]